MASARSSETFVALCLLVVLGMGALTEAMGLSSTLGAFLAGTLLAETNYRTTVTTEPQVGAASAATPPLPPPPSLCAN